ncbi:Glycylpeptide N-tetradecanoyltransferase 2 [Cichlidogyrus casuarinus]|uniref:glycylpeptide N-tetradecanoyltransferase n=1 Tax=Cichlidogyrus casuarinus TaxID=1844966 RepID=A0ABD2QN78_9PLAT
MAHHCGSHGEGCNDHSHDLHTHENNNQDLLLSGCADPHCNSGHCHDGPAGDMAALNAQLTRLMQFNKESQVKSKKSEFKFWSTQPVPDFDEDSTENKAIEEDRPKKDVKSTPYQLPDNFSWSDLDLNNDEHLDELYNLLYENYVEDDDHIFRFNYSREFLKW